ncbi:MAG: signal peptidase I [Candidatus Bathyarchaeota archaeon]|nr:MAG: signal peptidase I [Candidatus Bathyarchaeota archaeon]
MKLSEMLKKEYVKTAILLAVVVISVFAFWISLTTALKTEYPMLAVASGSMEPTLYKGDLIMVQGVSTGVDINVGPKDSAEPGDIIVFHRPTDPSELIVHRAIDKELRDGTWYFQTKGDANFSPDSWELAEDHLVGKVVGHVSHIGYIPLFLREFLWTPIGMILIVTLLLIFLFYDYIPLSRKKDQQDAA